MPDSHPCRSSISMMALHELWQSTPLRSLASVAVLGMLAAACSDSAPEGTSPATASQPPIAAPADTTIAPAVNATTEP